MIAWSRYKTTMGDGAVVCQQGRITAILLPPQNGHQLAQQVREHCPAAGESSTTNGFSAEMAAELSRYFEGNQPPADLIKLIDWPKTTASQRAVMEACVAIPKGKVVAYWELAREAGMKNPRGCGRFVGNVMATNILPLVVPCHRVVTSDYRIGNYGGGVEMKRHLLRREGAMAQVRG